MKTEELITLTALYGTLASNVNSLKFLFGVANTDAGATFAPKLAYKIDECIQILSVEGLALDERLKPYTNQL